MKPPRIRSSFMYDVTREMRRLHLSGRLEACHPDIASGVLDALESGGRIVYSPDEDDFYREFEMDQVYHDPRTGKTCGVRRL